MEMEGGMERLEREARCFDVVGGAVFHRAAQFSRERLTAPRLFVGMFVRETRRFSPPNSLVREAACRTRSRSWK
jgi:hypothetical protein